MTFPVAAAGGGAVTPDDLRDFRRFRAAYGAGQFRWGSPATTPAKRPGETNTCQTWTERQVLRLARLEDFSSREEEE